MHHRQLYGIVLVSQHSTIFEQEQPDQTTVKETSIPTMESKQPSNILDFFLALPVEYFSYSICGLPDSEAARKASILKDSSKNDYIKFEEECTGNFNEIVLFKDQTRSANIIALTKYHGETAQTFYLLEHDNGNWKDVREKLFPDQAAIAEKVSQNAAKLQGDAKERLEIALEENDTIPYEFYFVEDSQEVKVLLDREFTDEDVQLASINWKTDQFILL